MSFLNGKAPVIRLREHHSIAVKCPLCPEGQGVFRYTQEGSNVNGNFAEPIRCVSCGREFAVKYKIALYGAPLERAGEADPQPIRGNANGG